MYNKIILILVTICIVIILYALVAMTISLASSPYCQQLGFDRAIVDWPFGISCMKTIQAPLSELLAR